MIFGLSTARVGATLAIVLVGYNIIIGETAAGEPIRLLNEDVLNGTIIMILVTCTISSFVVEKAARHLALDEENVSKENEEEISNILISLAYPETVTELIDFGLMLKSRQSNTPVYALNIISEDENKTENIVKKMVEKAVKHAAATEQTIIPITRFDVNISNGIIYTLKEKNITDLLIGLHHGANQDNFLGPIAERILKHTSETVFIYKSVQPFNTLNRMIVAVTPKAELEPGFSHWLSKLVLIAKEAGLSLEFYASSNTIKELNDQKAAQKVENKITMQEFTNWNDFLIFTREVKKNDLLVIVSSRNGHISYQEPLEKIPYYLSNYFKTNSFIMLYPRQVEKGIQMDNVQYVDSSLAQTISDNAALVGKAKGWFGNLFKNKK
jgi:hypothetical protein